MKLFRELILKVLLFFFVPNEQRKKPLYFDFSTFFCPIEAYLLPALSSGRYKLKRLLFFIRAVFIPTPVGCCIAAVMVSSCPRHAAVG